MTYIYALIDPTTERVRYVGKSNNPQLRHKEHIREAKSERLTRKQVWIGSLLDTGVEPILEILEEVDDYEWQVAERTYIWSFGPSLTNATSGGDGITAGPVASEALRRDRSERAKKQWEDPEFRKTMVRNAKKQWEDPEFRTRMTVGKVVSEDAKRKMSESQKGKLISEETRQKIAAMQLGKKRKPHSEATKLKMREAALGRKLSENAKSKISEAQRGKKLRESTKRRISEALTGQPKAMTEVGRARLSEAMKLRRAQQKLDGEE